MNDFSAAAPVVVVDDVTVTYGSVTALEHASLMLRPGRVYGLIGMNGSGKSTLFKTIMGLLSPDSGTVTVQGQAPSKARRTAGISYVPQTEDIDWSFPVSVADVVMTGRYGHLGITRRPRRADHDAVAAALDRVELTDLAHRQIGELSGGQRKRAFVARGLAQGADVMLLDEPFAGVDKRTEATIIDVLRERAADGATVLVSTHDLAGLPRLADEAILLMRSVIARGRRRGGDHREPGARLRCRPPRQSTRGVMSAYLDLLIDPFDYGFMTRALLATVISSAVCALLSCWLVLIGWSLMGDAVSHAVLPGVVLAYVVGAPFALGAVVFGFLAVGLIGAVRDRSRVKEDAAIGIVFTTLFAFGLVLISVTPSQTDLNHIIFGNLLGVSRSDLVQIAVLGAVVAVVVLLKRRDLTLYAFDPTQAYAVGLNPRILGALLLGLLALTAVTALQVVGIVLVVAMLIIPGATAYLLTDRFGRMLVIAPVIAVIAGVIGLYVSYYADTSAGGMIVLVQGIVFGIVYLFSPKHGVVVKEVRKRRRRPSPEGDDRRISTGSLSG